VRAIARASILCAIALACSCCASASAAPAVKLEATFTPERLGAGTTVHVGFQIAARAGQAPSPVTGIQLRYPHGLGLASSDLGLETCAPTLLEVSGLTACPTDSLMGRGSAVVEVPSRTDSVLEQARVTLVSGPVQNGHLDLLYFVSGDLPVLARLVFPGLVLPTSLPFGGNLETKLPLVQSVPEGPDVALTQMQTTIGPSGITYTERVKGRLISFHPKGILLPSSCPNGGFPFAVRLSFQDGASARAGTRVPCPAKGSARKR
jgi:hypothetical protein